MTRLFLLKKAYQTAEKRLSLLALFPLWLDWFEFESEEAWNKWAEKQH